MRKLKIGDTLQDLSCKGRTVDIGRVTKTMAWSMGIQYVKFRRTLKRKQGKWIAHAHYFNKYISCEYVLITPTKPNE